MVSIHETDALGFRATLMTLGGTVELEIFDQDDGVSVRQHIAMGILHHAGLRLRGFLRPFVPARHALPRFPDDPDTHHPFRTSGRRVYS